MKQVFVVLIFLIAYSGFSQTLKVDINATCVAISKLHNKAIVAVRENDDNYPNCLLQMDPYLGIVENSMQLNGNPRIIKFTQDYQYLYVSYDYLSQIDKININTFQIIETIYVDEYRVLDFEISPINHNNLYVILKVGSFQNNIVVYKNGILQPNQIDDNGMKASELCIKDDGTRLFAHNGQNTGFDDYLIDIIEDGVEYDSIAWERTINNFGDIKSHNDLVYCMSGSLIDPFSDSIPIRKATMPVYKLSSWTLNSVAEFSEIHNCYLYGHEEQYKGYISFFHGEYYNYLGSLMAIETTERISDIDVVDENHFILVSFNGSPDYKNSLLFYSVEENDKSNTSTDVEIETENWFKNNTLIRLPIVNDNSHQTFGE